MSIVDGIIAELQFEAIGTRKVLARIPENELDWRPHQKSFTMGELASHVADIVTYTVSICDRDELIFDPTQWKPFACANAQELVEHFDKGLLQAGEALRTCSDEKMLAKWRMVMDGKELFCMPRVAVMRSMVLNHLVHHRAQLTVYLRMREIPVPGIYGPSADEE